MCIVADYADVKSATSTKTKRTVHTKNRHKPNQHPLHTKIWVEYYDENIHRK